MTDDDRTAPAAPAAPAAEGPRPYTAVVVFHGMGQQRHYETLWRVVEALDAHVFQQAARDARFIDKRLLLKVRRERLRPLGGGASIEELAYVEATQVTDAGTRRLRFYEGYWAPATVGGTSAASVLRWLLGQMTRPLKVLWAPWRSFSRLRRADLMNLLMRPGQPAGQDLPEAARTVYKRYAEFADMRPPQPGSFIAFLRYLSRRVSQPGWAARRGVMWVAVRWWFSHVTGLLRHTVWLLLAGLSVASVAGLVLVGCLEVLRSLSGQAWLQPWLARVGAEIEVDAASALSMAGVLAVVTGVAAFLRDALGDVQQFVTYQETDELHERRAKIMDEARKTLAHVLTDDACERVLVFAHSLGSAVALDTLLALRGFNQCAAPQASAETHLHEPLPLRKLEHLVTCGSPIDKISFFFATASSRVRGFERMVDQLRGDVGDIPFSKAGRQPHLHWVNFWDRGDPISGPIETVLPAELRKQRVDNVRLASLAWPDIGASHDAYFEHPLVVEHLYRAVFGGESSFADPPRGTPKPGHTEGPPVYDWRGPGQASAWQTLCGLLVPAAMLLLVWTTAGVVWPGLPAPNLAWLGAVAALLLAGAWIQRLANRVRR